MPDEPDWYPYRLASKRHALGDLGEQAVRLGSIVSYHRSGTVVFADGMENGLAPYDDQYPAGAVGVEVVTYPTYQGGFALKCTGADDSTGVAGILKRIQLIVLGKVGLEVTFSLDTANEAYTIQVQYSDGTNKHVFGLRFDSTNNELLYRTGSTTWVKVQDFTMTTGEETLFHTAKLVVDLVNDKFVKLYIDQDTIDLSAYSPWVDTDATVERLEFLTGVNSRSGEEDIAYIDNLIITTDEP